MNSAPRGHEATAARGAMISASVDIGGDDRESPSIGADQRRRDVQAMLTASHRTGSTRTRPGRLRPRQWTRMNQPSAGAGKKLASPRWRQPLPTRWARRSAANAVITLPIMRMAPPDGGRPASGDFAEYRLEARDIRQAGSQIDDGRQFIGCCAQTGTDRTAARWPHANADSDLTGPYAAAVQGVSRS